MYLRNILLNFYWQPANIIQFDGAADTSSEDEDDYENDENEDEEDEAANEEEVETGGVEEVNDTELN